MLLAFIIIYAQNSDKLFNNFHSQEISKVLFWPHHTAATRLPDIDTGAGQ